MKQKSIDKRIIRLSNKSDSDVAKAIFDEIEKLGN